MGLFAKYFVRKGNSRTYLQPGKMRCITIEPKTGDEVIINGNKYEITGANYDYELWQAFGDIIYDISVEEK